MSTHEDAAMGCFSLHDMQQIQRELQAKYQDKWGGLSPKVGRNQLLWMMIEAGEVADIIKKKGDQAIMDDPEIRAHFIEEMADVLMYFHDLMLCYNITPEDMANTYREKFERNMKRW